jgi:hypothetical protein
MGVFILTLKNENTQAAILFLPGSKNYMKKVGCQKMRMYL